MTITQPAIPTTNIPANKWNKTISTVFMHVPQFDAILRAWRIPCRNHTRTRSEIGEQVSPYRDLIDRIGVFRALSEFASLDSWNCSCTFDAIYGIESGLPLNLRRLNLSTCLIRTSFSYHTLACVSLINRCLNWPLALFVPK